MKVGAQQADIGEVMVRKFRQIADMASIEERAEDSLEPVRHARRHIRARRGDTGICGVVIEGGHDWSPLVVMKRLGIVRMSLSGRAPPNES